MPESTDTTTAVLDTETDIEQPGATEPELVEEDLLVEDVSIDGMCGVY